MDLIRAIYNATDTGVYVTIRQDGVLANTGGSVHLNGAISNRAGHVGGDYFDHGD